MRLPRFWKLPTQTAPGIRRLFSKTLAKCKRELEFLKLQKHYFQARAPKGYVFKETARNVEKDMRLPRFWKLPTQTAPCTRRLFSKTLAKCRRELEFLQLQMHYFQARAPKGDVFEETARNVEKDMRLPRFVKLPTQTAPCVRRLFSKTFAKCRRER